LDLIQVLKQAEAKLEKELKGIRNALFALAKPSKPKAKRRVSAASRRKMAVAAKLRWAKRKKLGAAAK
jgi:hypothetical protein